MILVFTAFPPKDNRASLILADRRINQKAKCSQLQQMRRAQTAEEELQAAEPALQEKNAIFSAWLMRRIGASGSLADTAGFRNMPLAMMVEPSDIPIGGAGAGRGDRRWCGHWFDGAGRRRLNRLPNRRRRHGDRFGRNL